MSRLVIAEKPSVGKSIAAVLGASKRQDGFNEGGGYIVNWCVGFLSELSEPEAYKEETVTALREMREALTDEDVDLREITDSVLTKLDSMTEEEFSKLELYPDFDE